MNYIAHYDRLISRAQGRVLIGYKERHHIIPRCLGGGNEPSNLVFLTGEEHYVAHQLLVRIHPHNGRLVHASVWMAKRCSGNKAYGWLRRLHAAAVSQTMMGNKSWLGKKHTEEWKAARSAAQTGKKMPAAGVEKMAASKRGKKISTTHREALLAAARHPKSTEHRAKIAAAHVGIKVSEDARRKIGEANRQRVFSDETRAKMSASHKGIPHGPTSPETRAKIAASHRARLGIGSL